MMVIKELKKIVFSKIIMVLLLSLCIVSVLYETRTDTEISEQAAQKEAYQRERIDNYSAYLAKVKEDGLNMQSFTLFVNNNRFQVENAKRTVEAYEAVKSVKPVYGNYKVIEKITEFGLADIILFVLVVQMALTLISREMKKGMLELLKSCRNGRVNLIVNKIAAMAITSAFVMVIVYGIKAVQLYMKYGMDNLAVPIQSVSGFYESNMPIQIWQYMILFFLLKWITMCIIGICAIAIISFAKNEVITYGIIFVGTTISLFISNNIEWNMSTAVLKMLSPATLLNTKSFTAQYMNINVLQYPFELYRWTVIIILLYLSAGMIFAVCSFIGKKGMRIPNLKFIRRQKEKKIRTRGILSYEQKKIWMVNKVVLFLLIFAAIQGYFISNNSTRLDYHDKCYMRYTAKVYGVPDEQSQNYLDTEQNRFDEIEEGYAELTEKFINGEVDGQAYVLASQEYSAQMAPYDDFQRVQQKNAYLKELKEKRDIEGWFTNDLAFGYILGDGILYDKDISLLLLLVVVIFSVVPVFTYDRQKEMLKLLDTTYHGRDRLIRNKYMSAIVISVILWSMDAIPWLVIILKVYKPDGLSAPAQSLMLLQDFPLHISILGVMILFYVCKCLGMILLGLMIVGISTLADDYIKNAAISLGLIVTPVVLYILGVEFLNQILFIPIVNMRNYFIGASVAEWVNLAVVVLAVVMLNFRNKNGKSKGISVLYRVKRKQV